MLMSLSKHCIRLCIIGVLVRCWFPALLMLCLLRQNSRTCVALVIPFLCDRLSLVCDYYKCGWHACVTSADLLGQTTIELNNIILRCTIIILHTLFIYVTCLYIGTSTNQNIVWLSYMPLQLQVHLHYRGQPMTYHTHIMFQNITLSRTYV